MILRGYDVSGQGLLFQHKVWLITSRKRTRMDTITVLICTHNRVELLERTLASLNRCMRPRCKIEILVVANACSDGTAALLERYGQDDGDNGRNRLPLSWIDEPRPGKSYALNRAIEQLKDTWVATVDDDHRVHPNFLVAIESAIASHTATDVFCGRIIPDWDGTEAAWLHDTGPFSVYPLPIPHYDLGAESFPLTPEQRLPGGGNWVIRSQVFDRVGPFSTALGPSGHNLIGGEDIDYIQRALKAGIRLRYVPEIVQYHFVDLERLKLPYLLKKAFYRSRSSIQAEGTRPRRVPRYLLRKLVNHLFNALLSLYWPETRFYMMRCASTLGEISAYLKDRGSNT